VRIVRKREGQAWLWGFEVHAGWQEVPFSEAENTETRSCLVGGKYLAVLYMLSLGSHLRVTYRSLAFYGLPIRNWEALVHKQHLNPMARDAMT
jgi:hypothetical protein